MRCKTRVARAVPWVTLAHLNGDKSAHPATTTTIIPPPPCFLFFLFFEANCVCDVLCPRPIFFHPFPITLCAFVFFPPGVDAANSWFTCT